MTSAQIGGRLVDITKEDNAIKIIFHPIAKNAKYPDAKVFTVKLSRKDIETLKKAF